MKMLLISILLSLTLLSCNTEQSEELPLLPFETYFTPDLYKAVRVSPNGKWLAYIAPLDGVDNYFVAPVANPQSGKAVTQVTDGSLRAGDVSGNTMYRWSRDSKYIIYPRDYNGNEAFDLWVVDIKTGVNRNLTPNPELKTSILSMSDKNVSEIAISENKMSVPFPNAYKLNLDTGDKQLIIESKPGVFAYFVDYDYEPRLNLALNQVGSFELQSKIADVWKNYHSIANEDRGNFLANFSNEIIHMGIDNKYLYAVSSKNRDTNGLFKWDLATGQKELLAEDTSTDLNRVIYDQKTHQPIAYASMWKRTVWHALDKTLQAELDFMMQYHPASDVHVESQSADNNLWTLRLMGPNNPTTYYLFDLKQKKMTKLFAAAPHYESMALAPMHPYEMVSPDGLKYISYYTLPVGSDSDSDGIPDKPMPSLMLVHGGPSDERAQYAFGGLLQWLSNRGYATFLVNFRGSAGFGKKFMSAQNGEWGGKMHQDLLDQVDWAVNKGIADKDHFGILGGSYGGYATLVGATMTPDVFACAISIVGPSTLEKFMPHWNVDLMSITLGGDPRTEEGRKFLASRSPVNFAHQTKIPVLVVQGAEDARVPQAQSDIIVEKMQNAGADVTYLLYPDEGHGIVKPHNTKSLWGISEQFFANCLGGRAEPIGDKLEGSTLQVPVGADKVKGLAEILAKNTAPE